MPRLLRSLALLPILSAGAFAQGAGAPPPAAPAAAPAPQAPSWKDLVSEGNMFKLYGFLRLDAQYDDSRANNGQTIGWILSEDSAAPPGVGAGGKNRENLTLHPRLTRVGVDVNGGTVSSLGDAKVTGKIEVDFYNSGLAGQTESRSALRMRHAYLKLAWSEWSLLVGQTVDVISPLMPAVNHDMLMWGAGNLGDRRPQIRTEWNHASGDSRWIVQTALGLTGAIDANDLDPAGTFGTGVRDGESSGLPTIQARLAYGFMVSGQKAEVGVWGHQAWEDPDGTFGGESDFESSAYGIDVSLPLYSDKLSLKTEAWVGENLDDVRGGVFQGINATTGEEIASKGGFIELGWKTCDRNSLHFGYANDNPENSDLNANGKAENSAWYVASRWNYKPVTFGLEYLNWTTKYVGLGDGDDNRVVAFVAYNF